MATNIRSQLGARGGDYANGRSAELFSRAQAVFPGGVTHDSRYMSFGPIYIDRADGSHKWDVDGHEYIDYWMGHGALLLGHSHPTIVAAVARQLPRGTHYGGSSELEVVWGELVQRIVPSAERVKFTSSGTEADIMALRLARAYTGRSKMLKFEGHFHGWSDTMTAGFQAPFNVPSSVGIPPQVLDTVLVLPANNLTLVEETLATDNDVACVILEPTGASYGTIPLEDGFLQGVRELTSKYGVVLIFDEVITGFRYSPGGIQEVLGITPDLTAMAKIVAGGLPGGAVGGRAEIMEVFEFRENDPTWNRYRRINHPGTFNANPLSAAAGVAMLNIAATGEVQQQVNAAGEKLTVELNRALQAVGVENSVVYGNGSILHIFLARPGDPAPKVDEQGHYIPNSTDVVTLRKGTAGALKGAVQQGLLSRGIDIMGGHSFMLSAAHTEEDLAVTAEAFYDTVAEIKKAGQI